MGAAAMAAATMGSAAMREAATGTRMAWALAVVLVWALAAGLAWALPTVSALASGKLVECLRMGLLAAVWAS